MALLKITVKSASGSVFEGSFDKEAITIGRSLKCDLVVKDESLSRQHALIENTGEGLFITDTGSANGVFIDGARIPVDKRTPINTFFQVSISQLSCEVLFLEDGNKSARTAEEWLPKDTSSPNIKKPAPVTKQKPAHLKKSDGSSKENQKKLLVPGLLAMLLIGLGGYFSMGPEKTAENVEAISEDPAVTNVPEAFKSIPDEFLSFNEYKTLGKNLSCESSGQLCKQMGLDIAKGEGAVLKDNELYVYVIPALRYEIPDYLAIKEAPDRDDSIATMLLFQADFFEEFKNKRIGQIHLIIKNLKDEGIRVLRFHSKRFSPDGPETKILLTNLNMGISSGILDSYRAMAKEFIVVQDL